MMGQKKDLPSMRNASAGVQFALTFMAFGAIGYWLDGEFGTKPWLLIVGVFLGAAGAFYSLVRQIPRSKTWAERQREKQNESKRS